jgi:hypothetical protein
MSEQAGTLDQVALRDWFAGQALSSMAGSAPVLDATDHRSVEMAHRYAAFAYAIADAMLKQRTVPTPAAPPASTPPRRY